MVFYFVCNILFVIILFIGELYIKKNYGDIKWDFYKIVLWYYIILVVFGKYISWK